MANAKFDIRTEATRPLYAGVGVTDLAVERVREFVADMQKRFEGVQKDVQTRINGFDFEPKALRKQATTAVNERVDALSKEAKARRAAIEARVNELQADAKELPTRVQHVLDENVTTVTDAYADLAKRGEVLVGRIRRQPSTKATVSSAKTTSANGKTTRIQATKATPTTATTAKKTSYKTSKKKSRSRGEFDGRKSSAKATATAGKHAAENAVQATTEAAKKVGD